MKNAGRLSNICRESSRINVSDQWHLYYLYLSTDSASPVHPSFPIFRFTAFGIFFISNCHLNIKMIEARTISYWKGHLMSLNWWFVIQNVLRHLYFLASNSDYFNIKLPSSIMPYINSTLSDSLVSLPLQQVHSICHFSGPTLITGTYK